jgi:hypothetical protein
MRVQASIQFSCATTGLKLETQFSTETRNLVVFRRDKMPMHCAFCGQQHYWRLIKYYRLVAKRQPFGENSGDVVDVSVRSEAFRCRREREPAEPNRNVRAAGAVAAQLTVRPP